MSNFKARSILAISGYVLNNIFVSNKTRCLARSGCGPNNT